jgi:hypothetical protein
VGRIAPSKSGDADVTEQQMEKDTINKAEDTSNKLTDALNTAPTIIMTPALLSTTCTTKANNASDAVNQTAALIVTQPIINEHKSAVENVVPSTKDDNIQQSQLAQPSISVAMVNEVNSLSFAVVQNSILYFSLPKLQIKRR